jgi:hypothetical protein
MDATRTALITGAPFVFGWRATALLSLLTIGSTVA